MDMQTSERVSGFGIGFQSGRLLPLILVSSALILAVTGCKRHGESRPKAQQPPATPAPATQAPATSSPETGTSSAATESMLALADFKSTSPFYPTADVTKVALDNRTLSEPSEYQDLMSALVRFLDTAAETEYPEQTPVARPAIKLDTAEGRYSYMLVPGDPAIKCYLPDKYMPWLYGDQEAYDELISTLDKLYGRPLPRERP